MFVLQDRYRFDYPVIARLGVDDKGKSIEQRFTVTFEPLNVAETAELDEDPGALTIADRVAKQDELLRRTIVDWKDVVDGDAKPVPFSTEALDAALSWGLIKIALYQAYTRAMSGQAPEERRLGN